MTPPDTMRFNTATIQLLGAVTGMDHTRLRTITLAPRNRWLLGMPWYRDDPGGAFVLGSTIHCTDGIFHAMQRGPDTKRLSWLLLMAHEVIHVEQAWRIGRERASVVRFAGWAVAQYTKSFFRNGLQAYSKATMEREAEVGRRVLRALLQHTGGCHPQHPVMTYVVNDDHQRMGAWLGAHHALIGSLRSAHG